MGRCNKSEHPFDSDEPIQSFVEDRLGFGPYTCALYRLIRDELPGDASFTIGIFGDWGVGKTSLMRMVQNLLAQEPDKFVTLYFDAWAFEDFENLFSPLIIELSKLVEGDREILKITQEILENIARIATARATEGEVLWSDIKNFVAKVSGKEEAAISLEYLKKVETLIQRVTCGRKTLVIFLDDLDRVHDAQKVINLIEDLLLLMDLPKVVYILALDRKNLLKAIQKTYYEFLDVDKDKANRWAENYLEKLIQLPLFIPIPHEDRVPRIFDRGEIKIHVRSKPINLKDIGKFMLGAAKELVTHKDFHSFIGFLWKWLYFGALTSVFIVAFTECSSRSFYWFYRTLSTYLPESMIYFWTFFMWLFVMFPLYLILLKLGNYKRSFSNYFKRKLLSAIDYLSRTGFIPHKAVRVLHRAFNFWESGISKCSGDIDYALNQKLFDELSMTVFGKFSKGLHFKSDLVCKDFTIIDGDDHIDKQFSLLFMNNPRKMVRFRNLFKFYKLLFSGFSNWMYDEKLIKEWVLYLLFFNLHELENRSLIWELLILEDRIKERKEFNKIWEGLELSSKLQYPEKHKIVQLIKERISYTRFAHVEKIVSFLYPYYNPYYNMEVSRSVYEDFLRWVLDKKFKSKKNAEIHEKSEIYKNGFVQF